MTDLASLIDAYPTLSPDERAEVDVRVAEHPEWAEAHADAQRLAALFDAATAADDADDLAQRTVARRLGLSLSDVDDAPGGPEWDAEKERIEARLDALAAEAEDPIRRYERLTGESLGTASATDAPMASASPLSLLTPAPDRPPTPARPRLRLLRASTWAAAAAVFLVAYGTLFAVSTATVSERARVAALGEIDAAPPPVLRGGEAVPTADRLVAAFDAIDDARQSTLGLFPSYDDAALATAADELAALTADTAPTSWESQEARLALGRVLLYQGRDAEAARVLGGLVEEGSYRGSAARRLLDAIRQGV